MRNRTLVVLLLCSWMWQILDKTHLQRGRLLLVYLLKIWSMPSGWFASCRLWWWGGKAACSHPWIKVQREVNAGVHLPLTFLCFCSLWAFKSWEEATQIQAGSSFLSLNQSSLQMLLPTCSAYVSPWDCESNQTDSWDLPSQWVYDGTVKLPIDKANIANICRRFPWIWTAWIEKMNSSP